MKYMPFFYAIVSIGLLVGFLWSLSWMTSMPGKRTPLFQAIESDEALETQSILKRHVEHLATTIGPRNFQHYENLNKTKIYLVEQLENLGFEVNIQTYQIDNQDYYNISVDIVGEAYPDELLIIGAHYDTAYGSPGANDNGSGVAAVLVLAQRLKNQSFAKTVRFVLFTNEEPPFFHTTNMGSLRYATALNKEKYRIKGMISLETMGYFSDKKNSQVYPYPLNWYYPSQGNFIGFVSNIRSKAFLFEAIEAFREEAHISSEGVAMFSFVPGVSWSDQWSFWKHDYPAIMVTDTAPYRYPHYHRKTDTPDKIDYLRLTAVVLGLEGMIRQLAD